MKYGKDHKCFIDRTGEKHITNQGYEIEIIEYYKSSNCTIKFKGGIVLKNIDYGQIKKGCIKNPLHPSVFGVGYLGYGKYKTEHKDKSLPEYSVWSGIIDRCYNKKTQEKIPTYKMCRIAEEWKCYQNFAEWYNNNLPDNINKWQLDKDILVKGNKIYSPETCTFVPAEINLLYVKCDKARGELPIGVKRMGKKYQARLCKHGISVCLGTFNTIGEAFKVYKKAKESHIKEVAKKWKRIITKETYTAMCNYKVEITD